MQEYLRHFVVDKEDSWPELLTSAEFTYNNSVHSSTGHTPFQMVYGMHPNTPLTLGGQLPELAVPAVKEFVDVLLDNWVQARTNLQAAQLAQRKVANRRRRAGPTYGPGDLVMLSSKHLTLNPNGSKKFKPRWFGPVEVASAG